MTWDKVFLCIGFTFVLMCCFSFIAYIYDVILTKKLEIERNKAILQTELINSPESRAYLPLKLEQIKNKIPKPFDWNENFRGVFIITVFTSLGLILLHFGIFGNGSHGILD